MDADKMLIRCSSIGKIMTNGTDRKSIGKTAKSYLKQIYREQRYDRTYEFSSKYTRKGTDQEELAITLFSLVTGTMFKKNKQRLSDDFLSGEPDLFAGDLIDRATEGWDTKCSWDLWTFPVQSDELDDMYYYQNMGYMALTGADKWTTVFCLVNATADLVQGEKRKVYFNMGCPNDTDEAYIEKCIEIEKNMIYDIKQFRDDNPHYDMDCKVWKYDIPEEERIVQFEVQRDDEEIEKIYNRVREARTYIKSLINPVEVVA